MRAFFSGSIDRRRVAVRLGVALLVGLATPWTSLRLVDEMCLALTYCPGLEPWFDRSPMWLAGPVIGLIAGVAVALIASAGRAGWLGLGLAAVGAVLGALPAVAAISYGWSSALLAFAGPYVLLLAPPILVGMTAGNLMTRWVIGAAGDLTMPRLARLGLAFLVGLATPLATANLIADACRSSDLCPAPHLVLGPAVGLVAGAGAALVGSTVGAGWLALGLAVAGTIVGALPAAAAFGAWREIVAIAFLLTPPILVGLAPAYLVSRLLLRTARGPTPPPGRDAEAL